MLPTGPALVLPDRSNWYPRKRQTQALLNMYYQRWDIPRREGFPPGPRIRIALRDARHTEGRASPKDTPCDDIEVIRRGQGCESSCEMHHAIPRVVRRPWIHQAGTLGFSVGVQGCESSWEIHHAILRVVRRPRIHQAGTLGFSVGARDANRPGKYTTPYLGLCVALGYTMPQH